MKTIIRFFLVIVLVESSSVILVAQPTASDLIDGLWYKNSIIYTFHVNTFQDSDGDGIGDFKGAIKRLDYLNSLGVDVLWLAPFQSTSDKDDGYDVTDYYTVDPHYGNNGDFIEFMHQADKLGMRVIIDLVVNHTSRDHPWFKEAERSRMSAFRSWYVWSDTRPSDWKKDMVFPGVQKETWTFDSTAGQYYYHKFYDFQPELNYKNPEVQAELKKIIAYWLTTGVSGFRLDAVPFIIEMRASGDDKPWEDFNMITLTRKFIDLRKSGSVMLGEANILPDKNSNYFGKEGDGINMMFNFYVNQHLFYALATANVKPLEEALNKTRDIPPTAQWAFFLRNHDELDLGRLSKVQRQEVFDRFAPDTTMQLYDRGIRRRLAPMLQNNRKQLELAYSLLFSLPGTPVMRYGDEIGMGDDLRLKEREPVRTPMQWDASSNAGFSMASKTKKPVIDTGEYTYKKLNVEDQRVDQHSLLNWMANIIRTRKECPEIGTGNWKIIESKSPHVLIMRYDKKETTLLLVHNFSDQPQIINIKKDDAGGEVLKSLLDKAYTLEIKRDPVYSLTLEGYGYRWFRIRRSAK